MSKRSLPFSYLEANCKVLNYSPTDLGRQSNVYWILYRSKSPFRQLLTFEIEKKITSFWNRKENAFPSFIIRLFFLGYIQSCLVKPSFFFQVDSIQVCKKRMRSGNLTRHMKIHNSTKPCSSCGKDFRSDLLLRHELLCRDNVDEARLERGPCLRTHAPNRSSVEVCQITFLIPISRIDNVWFFDKFSI